MFWPIYFAHLVADYPFQSNRLVELKKTWWGLLIHVAIHGVVTTAVLWPVIAVYWPFVVALLVVHYGIDTLKTITGRALPKYVVTSYFIDQVLHFASIVLLLWLMPLATVTYPIPTQWFVLFAMLLAATHVTYITERVATLRQKAWQDATDAERWPRMGMRFVLVLLGILTWPWLLLVGVVPWLLKRAGVSLGALTTGHRARFVAIDAATAFVAAAIVVLLG